MSDDAATGATFVGIVFVVAVAQGMWLLAVPCALLLVLVVLALV
jgi:hypothetical protein